MVFKYIFPNIFVIKFFISPGQYERWLASVPVPQLHSSSYRCVRVQFGMRRDGEKLLLVAHSQMIRG